MSMCTPWRHITDVEVWLHAFLTWAFEGSECSASCPAQRPLHSRPNGSQNQFGHFEKRINKLLSQRESNAGSSSPQPKHCADWAVLAVVITNTVFSYTTQRNTQRCFFIHNTKEHTTLLFHTQHKGTHNAAFSYTPHSGTHNAAFSYTPHSGTHNTMPGLVSSCHSIWG
jgi:hypothetical protein